MIPPIRSARIIVYTTSCMTWIFTASHDRMPFYKTRLQRIAIHTVSFIRYAPTIWEQHLVITRPVFRGLYERGVVTIRAWLDLQKSFIFVSPPFLLLFNLLDCNLDIGYISMFIHFSFPECSWVLFGFRLVCFLLHNFFCFSLHKKKWNQSESAR